MKRRLTPIALLLTATTFVAGRGVLKAGDPVALTVHEWGTFTSIAGRDGRAVEWLPQSGPTDLPCFVDRIGDRIKWNLSGTVRMETPVIYFYAPRETTVSVKVRFPGGTFTEWFPRAVVTRPETISWTDVRISTRAPSDFPRERGANHYYVARQTDASPLQVGKQTEKFLFYRGVGRFAPPIAATVSADGTIIVKSIDGGAVGDVMLFENRRGAIDFQVQPVAQDRIEFDPSAARAGSRSPAAHLEKMLVARGLYPKEAAAMVETWRDSWFEQGTRLFYVVSRAAVDSILPLEVQPEPADLTRVFVGRMELVTAATEREVRDGIAGNDKATLSQYARFLRPIADRLLADMGPADRARLERGLAAYFASIGPAGRCS
jgi:hypothetical protein